MTGTLTKALATLLVILSASVVTAATGCSDDTDDGATTRQTEPTATSTVDGVVDDHENDTGSATLTAEQRADAIDVAGAYLAAKTDFKRPQFGWKVEAAARADDGTWYARISASPQDASMEVEQIYVYSPADSGFWIALDMGTGIDPATDERFPEEVRGKL
ncbi:MAG: hypothetical protein JW767_09565 [Thermoleophilia bacterium]|nr:hypothetical protein [Thermoleophilia bacterium]